MKTGFSHFAMAFFLVWAAGIAVIWLSKHPEIIVAGLLAWLVLCLAVVAIVVIGARRSCK